MHFVLAIHTQIFQEETIRQVVVGDLPCGQRSFPAMFLTHKSLTRSCQQLFITLASRMQKFSYNVYGVTVSFITWSWQSFHRKTLKELQPQSRSRATFPSWSHDEQLSPLAFNCRTTAARVGATNAAFMNMGNLSTQIWKRETNCSLTYLWLLFCFWGVCDGKTHVWHFSLSEKVRNMLYIS